MKNTLEIIKAEDLYFDPLPNANREMIIEDLVPQGLTLLAGAPKSCKSWMALDMCLAVSSGRPFLGKQTLGCGAAYFALEDTKERLQDRLLSLGEEPSDKLYLMTKCSDPGNSIFKDMNEILETYPDVRFIVIDTLQKIRKNDSGSNINQYGKDDEDLSKLKNYADRKHISILVVHHTRKLKDRENPLNDVLGSTAMSGVPDSILVLEKRRTQVEGELLSVGRDCPQFKMIIRFEELRWKLLETISEEELVKEEIPDVLYKIAEYIKGAGSWSGTMSQLLEVMGDKEMTPSALSTYLTKYYYQVFYPLGISKSYRKTARERIHTLELRTEIKSPVQKEAGAASDEDIPYSQTNDWKTNISQAMRKLGGIPRS